MKSISDIIQDAVDNPTDYSASEDSAAFNKAAGYIMKRMRTEKEIRRYLSEKDYSSHIVDAAIDKLKEYKYIDDANYAMVYVQNYGKKFGAIKLKYSLKQLGVSSELIESALESIEGDVSSLKTLASRYLRVNGNSEKAHSKLPNYLYSKGFDWDSIRQVLAMIKEEIRHAAEDEESSQAEE